MRIEIKFEPKQEKELCKSYQDGASIEALAFEYSVSTTVIRRILKSNGVTFHRRGAPGQKQNKDSVGKAKSLKAMGLTIARAAGFMGLSERSYRRLLTSDQ